MASYADEAVEFSSCRRRNNDLVGSGRPYQIGSESRFSRRKRLSDETVPGESNQDGVENFVKSLYNLVKENEVDDFHEEKKVVKRRLLQDDKKNISQNDEEKGGVPSVFSFSAICVSAVDKVGTMQQLLKGRSPSSPGMDHGSQFDFNDVIFPAEGEPLLLFRPTKQRHSKKTVRDPEPIEELSYYERTKILHAKQLRESGGAPGLSNPASQHPDKTRLKRKEMISHERKRKMDLNHENNKKGKMLNPETQTASYRRTQEPNGSKTLGHGFSTAEDRLLPCATSSFSQQVAKRPLNSGAQAKTESNNANFSNRTLSMGTPGIVGKPRDKINAQNHATVCKNNMEQTRTTRKNTYKRKRSDGKGTETPSSQYSVKSWPQSSEGGNFLSCIPVAATSTSIEDSIFSSSGGSGSLSLRRCTNCQLAGHDRRNCPKPRLDGDGQEIKFKRKCSRCGEYGHDRRLCTKSNQNGKINGNSVCLGVSNTSISNGSNSLHSEAKGTPRRKAGTFVRTKKKMGQDERKNQKLQSAQSLQPDSKSLHRSSILPPSTLTVNADASQESFSLKVLKEKLKKFSQARVDADVFRNSQRAVHAMETSPLFAPLPKESQPQSVSSSNASLKENGRLSATKTRRKDAGAEEVGKAHVGEGSGDESEQSSAANSTFDSPLQSGMEGGVVPSLLASLLSGVGVTPLQGERNFIENPHVTGVSQLGSSPALFGEQSQQQFHEDTSEFMNQNDALQPNINQLFSTFLSQQKMAAVMAMNFVKAAEHNLMNSKTEQDQ